MNCANCLLKFQEEIPEGANQLAWVSAHGWTVQGEDAFCCVEHARGGVYKSEVTVVKKLHPSYYPTTKKRSK